MDLTKEQKEFLEKTEAHRKEKVEELAYKVLAQSLKDNINVFDAPYYVLQRVRQIIQDALNKTSFDDESLRIARTKFLKKCLKEVKKNISPLEIKKEKDETDERNIKCEPVAQAVVAMLLDEGLIFSDEFFFAEVLKNEESVPLKTAIAGYASALDDKILMIISTHWQKAQEKMFGVPKENLTFSMLDDILKK